MKTQLTAEQSANLISKGIKPYKASAIVAYNDPISQWTNRGQPIFTLTDLLSLLPEEIEVDGNRYRLRMEIYPLNSEWTAAYVNFDNDHLHRAMAYELIDCLYHLALYCADNNYLNKE